MKSDSIHSALYLGGLLCAGIIATGFLTSCATSALDLAPEASNRPWIPNTNASGEIIPGHSTRLSVTPGQSYVLPLNRTTSKLLAEVELDNDKIYTLAELIDVAESANPSTRIAWEEARRVALAEGIVESSYLPRLSAAALGAYTSESASTNILGTNYSGTNSDRGAITAVSFQWLLYDFGERGAIVDAAKQASVVSNIAFTAAHQRIIYAVTLAFYAHAAAKARAKTAQESLESAAIVEEAARRRYAGGTGTIVDAAQAKQAMARAQLAVVQATGALQDAYITLLVATGLSPLSKIQVADVSGRQLSPALDVSIEQIVENALARRPDVLAAFAQQKISMDAIDAARAEFQPKIFMSANASYGAGHASVSAIPSVGSFSAFENVGGSHLGGTIFLGLTVPLYDGNIRGAQLAQARAGADLAEENLDRVKQEAIKEIVLADNALRTALESHAASITLRDAAQTLFDSALASYQHGIGSISALAMAQTQLLEAKNASSDTYSAALSAAATLALASGALGKTPD